MSDELPKGQDNDLEIEAEGKLKINVGKGVFEKIANLITAVATGVPSGVIGNRVKRLSAKESAPTF